MKTLWFKFEFVAPILSGEKRDTIRVQSTRLPRVGDVVAFSVGSRTPFAQCIVDRIETVTQNDLPQSRSKQLAQCAIDTTKPLVRLTFSVQRKATALLRRDP